MIDGTEEASTEFVDSVIHKIYFCYTKHFLLLGIYKRNEWKIQKKEKNYYAKYERH